MLTGHAISLHLEKIRNATRNIAVTRDKEECSLSEAYNDVFNRLTMRKLIFIGNGGSAAIASHMAIDYSKNGGYQAMVFNDIAAITCLANDYSYADIFALQIGIWANEGDMLFAISSSGRSPNIIKAVEAAKNKKCFIVTLSAFDSDNLLRLTGNINFYVPTHSYGIAEISHLTILHSILDLAMKEKI